MGHANTMLPLVTLTACLAAASAYPRPQGPGPAGPLPIPRPGADGSYTGGNPDHNREEYLSQKDHTFKAKLKWSDAYGGHGEHYYDINHGAAYKEPVHAAPAYAPPAPAYDAGRR